MVRAKGKILRPLPDSRRAGIFVAAALLTAAALAAWANSFRGPFIFDDLPAIVENATIRTLALPIALAPPHTGQPANGRPLVNFSFALNWAVGGADVRGYHVLNLAIHVLAALALFGVVRRTLRSQALAAKSAADATPLAFAVAALWMFHPLQTESVTYISQRAESLAGLCLLLTLYASIRGADSPTPVRWHALAIVTCLLGMATKEVMYAAPLLVLLHDRTFSAGTFREALRRRPWFYATLAATWLLLAWLVKQAGNRGATAGFGLGITPWHYLLTQCGAVVHYMRLAFWPAPLVLDYGVATTNSLAQVWPQAALLLALFGATLLALVRRPPWGFLGAWFFLLLAPTSSVLPLATQTIAEHRMYLPLAAIIVAIVVGGWHVLGRRSVPIFVAIAIVFGALTARRNIDYRSAISIWQDNIAKRPDSPRPYGELASALSNAGRVPEALAAYETAVRLLPNYPKVRHNYAVALAAAGRLDEAVAQFELALAQLPTLADARYELGNVRHEQGRNAEALACYEEATRLRPDFALAHNNAANILANFGRTEEALAHYAAAAHADPNLPDAQYNWANTLAQIGRFADAVPHYEAALQLAPALVSAHENLGVMLFNIGRYADAVGELEIAQSLAPDSESIRANLATARARAAR
ncbi:MAG TPA: tetratricopeptide repeat protein [Candidatus Udaeobacter sp.]|jgi:tetratricopeptide (TPR) repeat protein